MLAMQRAFNELGMRAPVKIDGNQKPKEMPFAVCVPGGDKIIPQISAASIIAKVERDKAMEDLHLKIPQYQINKNKGYGTKAHFRAIEIYGLSSHHRKKWNLGRNIPTKHI
jgi:ribonuclease HII